MFRHFLVTASRHFLRNRLFSFIHVIGLAVGLAGALLILLYIQDELTYDSMHPHADHTYRLGNLYTQENGETRQISSVPSAWSNELKEQFPEITHTVKHTWFGYPVSITYEENDIIRLSEEVMWSEASWVDVFDFQVVYGSKASALNSPNKVALSRSFTESMFGDIDPVGKDLLIEHPFFQNGLPAIIGAVYEDYPSNSHVAPEMIVNFEILTPEFGEEMVTEILNSWEQDWFANYIVVAPGTDLQKLHSNLEGLIADHTTAEFRGNATPVFRQMKDIHFDQEFEWTRLGMGDIRYIYMFGTIALMLIIIACINYMNLATARAARRAKEIGMRKALGSQKGQLRWQFLGESFLTVVLASILAFGIMIISLIPFNQLAQKSFEVSDLFSLSTLGITLGVILLVGFLAGLYPALVLSRFKPVEVFKGQITVGKGSERFRKGLVVFQFCISVILIVSTIVVVRQMNFLESATLSKESDQMLSIRFGGVADPESYQTFKSAALQQPGLEVVTMGNHLPRQDFFGGITYNVRLPGVRDEALEWDMLNVEHDFHEAFEFELLAGRLFEEGDMDAGHRFLINETAIQSLDMSAEEALGMTVSLELNDTVEVGQVVGVIEDFSYRSVMHLIDPLLITVAPHPIDKIVYTKLPSGNVQEAITSLEAAWKEVYPGTGFDYWFVDEEFSRMYDSESRLADLIQVFALIAILVACLGVFGLSAFMAERRTKEMGIRKVLGAPVSHIMVLLSSSFVRTVLLACVIALPLAWYLMNSWLENFVYSASLSWWIFVGTVVLVLSLTLLTTAYETVKTALSNPLDHMRED